MAEIKVEGVRKNSKPHQKSICHDNRRLTDRIWIILFVFCFVFLVNSWNHVVIKYDAQADSDNSTTANKTSNVVLNATDREINWDNRSILNETIDFVPHFWGKNWLFDAITCNVGFLDAHYEKSGSVVIWANVLICVCLIMYSFASMRTDDLYCGQFCHYSLFFFACAFGSRSIHFLLENPSWLACVTCWTVPEVILFVIVNSKWSPKRLVPDSPKGKNGIISVESFLKNYPFGFLCVFHLITFTGILLKEVYTVNWGHQLSYVFVGVSCYVCLTFYYLVLMTMSCATSLSFDRQHPRFKDFFRALFIVTRYHFGTVCYHATLILPRVHATFVMNEKEFRKIPKFSALYRFYLTHWKVNSLSSMMTAASGRNHSGSVRELLRIFGGDLPKRKNFQSHIQIFKCFFALLMAINSLLLISLWAHGLVLDPRFLIGTWAVILMAMIFARFIAKSFDAVTDALWIHYDGNVIIKF